MSAERNSILQRLFDIAKGELAAPGFVAGVMARIDRLRWRAIFAWATLAVALAACAWLLTPMLAAVVQLLTQLLPQSLGPVEYPASWLGRLLAPLNSVATIAAAVLLLVSCVIRKLFR